MTERMSSRVEASVGKINDAVERLYRLPFTVNTELIRQFKGILLELKKQRDNLYHNQIEYLEDVNADARSVITDLSSSNTTLQT